MIWKIFFIITSVLFFMGCVQSVNEDTSTATFLVVLVGLLLIFIVTCVLGVFYSLGWKKQLFPKKSITTFNVLSTDCKDHSDTETFGTNKGTLLIIATNFSLLNNDHREGKKILLKRKCN